MVFSNLVHRPLRTMISVFAISIEVTLILLIVGLCMSMLNDNADRQKGIGFDVMVSPPGSSFFTGITGAPVSMKVADKLRQLPHVTAVAPIVTHFITSKSLEIIDGIDLNPKSPNNFDKMGPPFQYLAGGPFQGPYDMIVDDLFAATEPRQSRRPLRCAQPELPHLRHCRSMARARAAICPLRPCRICSAPRARPACFTSRRTSRKTPRPLWRTSNRFRGWISTLPARWLNTHP